MKRDKPQVLLPEQVQQLLPFYATARQALERARTLDDAIKIRNQSDAVRAYAVKARDRQLEFDAVDIRLRATRRLGELLIQMRAVGERAGRGRPEKIAHTRAIFADIPRLRDLGVERSEALRASVIARLHPSEFEARMARIRGTNQRPSTKNFLRGGLIVRRDEYLTPRDLIDMAVAVMGEIDLDPCAECKAPAHPNVPATGHLTKEDDGFRHPWTGRIFMNPGNGRDVNKWAERLLSSYIARDVTEFIALMPARLNESWFGQMSEVAIWCALQGSIKWGGVNGAPDFSNAHPFVVFHAGPHHERFVREFRPRGPLIRRMVEVEKSVAQSIQGTNGNGTDAN
jgi:hypothetical protein